MHFGPFVIICIGYTEYCKESIQIITDGPKCIWFLLIFLNNHFYFSPHSRSFSSLSEDSEEARARYLFRQWLGLGLNDVHLSNHTVLLSLPGSTPNTITDWSSRQCFLPNGIPCDQRGMNDLLKQHFFYAAYSAVGSVQVLCQQCELTFPVPKVASPFWLLCSSLAPPPPHSLHIAIFQNHNLWPLMYH